MPLLRANHRGCIHCHQVQEYRLLQTFAYGTFQRDDLFRYPLPENVGLMFDRDHGHRIAEILPGSAAAKAALQTGDVITRVNGIPIHSEEDTRWALHRASENKPITLAVSRPSKTTAATDLVNIELNPQPGWRQTELGWRKSLRSIPVPWGFLAYSL